jgi:hypothetical protein
MAGRIRTGRAVTCATSLDAGGADADGPIAVSSRKRTLGAKTTSASAAPAVSSPINGTAMRIQLLPTLISPLGTRLP